MARALAADPPVLLMDEPFGAIDPVTRARLQQEFLTLQQRLRKTVVLVTHDIDEAVLLGDRIALLAEGGVLAQHGTPDELLTRPASPFVASFVGHDRGLKRLAVTPIDPAWLEPLSGDQPRSRRRRRPAHLRDGDAAGCTGPGAAVARGRGDRHRRRRPADRPPRARPPGRGGPPRRGRARRATATLRLLTAPDVLLADVVSTSAAVAATSARSAKIAAVAELLRQVPPAGGRPPSWPTCPARPARAASASAGPPSATSRTLEPAPTPTLEVLEVDAGLDRIEATTGAGSQAAPGHAAARPLRAGHEPRRPRSCTACCSAICARARSRA